MAAHLGDTGGEEIKDEAEKSIKLQTHTHQVIKQGKVFGGILLNYESTCVHLFQY